MFKPGTDYLYQTVPQSGAGDRVITWPRGKILGGSSAGNGMYIVRPHAKEINAMHDLIATGDNKAYADSWTWDAMFDAMKGTETLTPPLAADVANSGIRYSESSHGKAGRLQTTFSHQIPIISRWLPTIQAAGVKVSDDAYGGDNTGGFISTLAITQSNWTRSYAKSAYIDNLPPLSNLHILVNSQVTKVTFSDKKVDGGIVATGVEFAASKGATPTAVLADKEVILAGGAVGSPHMLLVSGVGPKEVLQPLGITVNVDLPGVGEHMQDHAVVKPSFTTTEPTQGDLIKDGSDYSKTAEFNSFVNAATSYIDGKTLFETEANYKTFTDGLTSILNDDKSLAPLYSGNNSEVNAGYKAIYKSLVEKVYPEAGLLELLYSVNAPGLIMLQTAIQTPLSQGRLAINSTSIFDPPVLDPRYFRHPSDIVILRQGVKFARKIAAVAPLKDIITGETAPGPDVQTDDQIDAWIRAEAETEFHPGCTCAMLPRELGGVIDASLKVYGTANVRVIDGSVFPLSMSAHLMAPIYGLAESAAALILNPPSGSSGTKTSTGKGSSSTGKASTTGDSKTASGAATLSVTVGLVLTVFGGLSTLLNAL
jgi:choline dehydrogenase-like flavoprotein